MDTLLIIVVLGAGLGTVYLALLDGRYQVRRSRRIHAGIDNVYRQLCDFRSWPEWSPWLIHEPETRLEFSDNCEHQGGSYSWNGTRIGAGRLTHVQLSPPAMIEQRLEFSRPFKATCTTGFDLEEIEDGTLVTWKMDGQMPFLFRPMTARTAEAIARDYDLGLAMLEGSLDPSSEHPQLSFEGETTLPVQRAACCYFSGGIDALRSAMETTFPILVENVRSIAGHLPGPPFTAYHKVDTGQMEFECDLAVPVAAETQQVDRYSVQTFPGGRYFKTVLKGDTRFLDLAWHSAAAHLRMLKLKKDKWRPSMEIYNNDVRCTAPNERVTTLYIPIK